MHTYPIKEHFNVPLNLNKKLYFLVFLAYTWHRDMFIRTLNPEKKNVLILLDRGNSMTPSELDIGRAIAGFIIDSMNVNDHISLLTLDSELSEAPNQDCVTWSRCSDVTKKALHSHLNSINRMKSFDTVLALKKSKEFLSKRRNEKVHLFFITASKSIKSPDAFLKACQELSKGIIITVGISVS